MMTDNDFVRLAQELMGLRVDGIPGPVTVAEARKRLGAPAANSAPVAGIQAAGRILQGSARYVVDEVVVHCSATRPEWFAGQPAAAKVAEIRRWHMVDRKWRDIGYHWIIDRDGTVLPGRAENQIGAGVQDHNRGVLHVCLIGGHGSASNDQFARHFTISQDTALRSRIADIRARTPIARVSGHNEHAAKACPGFNVPAWLSR